MPRSNRQTQPSVRAIVCLDTVWSQEDLEIDLSVRPLLDLIAKTQGVKRIHLCCNTYAEFAFNLHLVAQYAEYCHLYLSFHGNPGELALSDGTAVTLEELASEIGQEFAGWTFHFGSCGTLDVTAKRAQEFLAATGAEMAIGYTEAVNWIESAALDLLIMQGVQGHTSMAEFWQQFADRYPDLVAYTGLRAFVAA